jgi:hypothetical protein
MNAKTDRSHLSDVIRWALEVEDEPATAAANWLARDIDATCRSAIDLVTLSGVPLEHLQQAKHVFKTMRMIGETKADRRLGGQLYLAAIASALAYHGRRISRQSDHTLHRALTQMADDSSAASELRVLARNALRKLKPPDANGQKQPTPQ